MADLDAVDQAFVESIVPEGCIASGFIALVTWLDGEGTVRWQLYTPMDLPTSQCIGLLEMAKHQMMHPEDDGDE